MAMQELTISASGHEMQFATNHLGHFALALGLHDALAAADSARIVSVSSGGHLRSPVVFDDIDFAFRDYDPFGAYGQSKTANVLFAVEATRRWADDGIISNALMPGGILTPLQRHLPSITPRAAEERFRRAGTRLEDCRAGRRDFGAAGHIAAAGRCRRPVLRGLQRGDGCASSRGADDRRCRTVCARPGQRRTAVGTLAEVDSMRHA